MLPSLALSLPDPIFNTEQLISYMIERIDQTVKTQELLTVLVFYVASLVLINLLGISP